MHPNTRDYFDEQLEQVLGTMPPLVHQLLERIPLYVEDHPSAEILRKMGIRHKSALCGLYTGVPLSDRSVLHGGVPGDVVHLFRLGILNLASKASGGLDPRELQRQIRITLLHELGHHHGMSENDLEELGY